jgi:hypothetical protein
MLSPKFLNALALESFRPTLLASGLRKSIASSRHASGARIYGPGLVVTQTERSEIEE